MEIVTYGLPIEGASAAVYYKTVNEFTEEVLQQADCTVAPVVTGFHEDLTTKREELRSWEEYVLECLALGVLLSVYSRGFSREGRGVKDIDSLIYSLDGTGEFPQEVKRLVPWRDYLRQAGEKATTFLTQIEAFSAWFNTRSTEVLGCYTHHVDEYLANVYPSKRHSEDAALCGRKRVEYHLNMVGAEIMNGAFRSSFQRTKGRAVLLPGCMRLHSDALCQAQPTALGARCVGCSKECKVNQLTSRYRAEGYRVLIVDHQSAISAESLAEAGITPEVGVVGVACVLNLVAGGWMLREAQIPAQCVLLNYCGCRQHWHREGIPTDLDDAELEQVLGSKEKSCISSL